MARKRFGDMNCAVAQTLDQIGDWWTLLLVRDAFFGTSTFSAFQERLGIAKNILSERLSGLVEHGIMRRVQTNPGVERYTYHLTDKGEDLLPVLVALMQWGDKWAVKADQEPLRILDAKQRLPIAPLAVTSQDGRALDLAALQFRPGPGANAETLEHFAKMKARAAG